MKYYNYQVTTSEVPDEITLCINITGCPIHCADCHSKILWKNIGEELTAEKLFEILNKNKGVTCVCIMGGDADYCDLASIFKNIYIWCQANKPIYLKTALYSGRNTLQDLLDRAGSWIKVIDYIKVGPFKKENGGLNQITTNQHMYLLHGDGEVIAISKKTSTNIEEIRGFDITSKFWK